MINPKQIINDIEKEFYLPPGSIISNSRRKTTIMARIIATYVVRKSTALSWSEIAQVFDRYDHSTPISNCKKVVKLINDPREYVVKRVTIKFLEKYRKEI